MQDVIQHATTQQIMGSHHGVGMTQESRVWVAEKSKDSSISIPRLMQDLWVMTRLHLHLARLLPIYN